MLQIEQFKEGQVWLLTNGPKRIARVISIEQVIRSRKIEVGQAPVQEVKIAVTCEVVTPAKPIKGFVTAEEADVNLVYRQLNLERFGYDMWTETWINIMRETVFDNPRIQNNDQWEPMVQVERVTGRHGAHEGRYKSGRITGHQVSGILLDPDLVPDDLFADIGADEATQAEKDAAHLKDEIIAEYKLQVVADEKEMRRGDAAECTQWKPASRLKMQMSICGIEKPDSSLGNFNEKSRAMLKTYLVGIGIDPWDVMDNERPEFQEAVDAARQKMSV